MQIRVPAVSFSVAQERVCPAQVCVTEQKTALTALMKRTVVSERSEPQQIQPRRSCLWSQALLCFSAYNQRWRHCSWTTETSGPESSLHGVCSRLELSALTLLLQIPGLQVITWPLNTGGNNIRRLQCLTCEIIIKYWTVRQNKDSDVFLLSIISDASGVYYGSYSLKKWEYGFLYSSVIIIIKGLKLSRTVKFGAVQI